MKTSRTIAGIDFILVRNKGQRSLRVHLDSSGNPIVSAPYHASLKQIDEFVTQSADWINAYRKKVAIHTWQTGDFVPYLGRRLSLQVRRGTYSAYKIDDDTLIITTITDMVEDVKSIIRQLYIDTVKDIMKDRVPYWCSKLKISIPKFDVNKAKGKWGVCYPAEKRLYLSYMCAILPPRLIDMTVLHESCHLIYGGHGHDFWHLMSIHMPDLEYRKQELSQITKSGWAMNIV